MGERMANADNFWLCMDEPTNLMVIIGFMEFEAPIDFNRLCVTIESRLASFPRFQKKIVMPRTGVGVPSWVDDEHYDLRSHLQRVALPAPGDKTELQLMISNLAITPLDPNKPLWQVHLIENYGKGCVLFFRIHHCITDGIAGIHVLLSTADTDPDAPWPERKPKKKPKPFSLGELLPIDALLHSAEKTFSTAQQIGRQVQNEIEKAIADPAHLKELAKVSSIVPTDFASVFSKYMLMSSDPNTAFKGKLGARKRIAWTEPFELDTIKKVGKAISTATLNDVLIATVTGAMRRYLKTRNTRVNELDLRVAVPVNVRKPGTESELGNKFSLVFLPLPVHLKDPVLRLKEIKRRMDRLKTSPDPYINFALLSVMGYLPPLLAKKAAAVFGNKASGVLTNVPGPRQPLYYAGQEVKNLMFWVPRSGQIGLGISILSYNGSVTVGIASDEGLMPDPEVLLDGFEDEFNALLDLVKSGKIEDEPLVLHDRYKEKQTASSVDEPEHDAPQDLPTMCQALTRNGQPCKNKALSGSTHCRVHGHKAEQDTQLRDVAQIMRELTR